MSDGAMRTILQTLRQQLEMKLPEVGDRSFIDFARENLSIRTLDNSVVPFVLRPIQVEYLERKRRVVAAGKPPKFLLLKYRRGGFTTVEQGLSYMLASRSRNVTVTTLAQNAEATRRLFRIPKLMHDKDPRPPRVPGAGNQTQLEFVDMNSLFYVSTAAGKGVGRGDTLSRVHWSEVAWSCEGHNQVEKQRAILIGLSEAASHGEMVLETTPNGSEMFREMYMDAKAGHIDWTPLFIPWFADASNSKPIVDEDERVYIMENLHEEEKRLVHKHGLSAEQIKWRRLKKRELKRMFYQEYPEDDETCWLISGTPFFDTEKLLRVRDYCRQPDMVEFEVGMAPYGARRIPGGYSVEWSPPVAGVQYVLGADTSEGLPGCDPGGIGVMRKDTGEQVFATHGMFNPRVLAEQIVSASRRYNDALSGIERNNHGHAVIQKVIDLGMSRPHYEGGPLYCHAKGAESVDDKRVSRAGWNTSTVTRPVMLDGIRDLVEMDGAEMIINDRHFINECTTFRMQASGSFEADPGANDDTVMKWAIANQMRMVQTKRRSMSIRRFVRGR